MHINIAAVVTWILANKGETLADVSAIIGAASVLVASLAKLVDLLVGVFPALKVADDKLHWTVSWLAGIASSPFLNSVAFNPKPKAQLAQVVKFIPPVTALMLVLAICAPTPVQAQPIFSFGPTLPLLEYRPGNLHPVQVAPGAGAQLSLTFPGLQVAFLGKSWDLLDFNLMAFGSAVSSATGNDFGALSGALGICTLSSLLCLAPAHDIATSSGTAGKWFWLFALNFNFGLAPTSPPAGVDHGPLGLPRGNFLYFGSP